MPVIGAHCDESTTSIIITAEFAAPVERVWQIYADPRQLEQVWGPPTHPASFPVHHLTPGARSSYCLTGPRGEQYHGYWVVEEVDEPHRIVFRDGFADELGQARHDLPVSRNEFTFEAVEAGTRVTYVSYYDTADDLRRSREMGALEGATMAINQIDDYVVARY